MGYSGKGSEGKGERAAGEEIKYSRDESVQMSSENVAVEVTGKLVT